MKIQSSYTDAMKFKLIGKRDEAKDTKTYFFEPQQEVTRKPGQYFYFVLPELHYEDPRGNKRQFTISSSPTEGNILTITVRTKSGSGFKRTLDELPEGTLVDADGPHGNYILDENTKGDQVFLAGGIGVTPFHCFMKYNIDKRLTDTNLHLIYTNSTPEEIAFRTELLAWQDEHPNIKVDLTVTHPEESQVQWNGLTGRVDEAMLRKLVGDLGRPTFWICGPPPMVDALDEMLGKLGIPTDRRKIEKFTGY